MTALSLLLKIKVKLLVIEEFKDLYTSLSTRRNSIDRSIRADVNVIRFEYEVGNIDEMFWLPGSLNHSHGPSNENRQPSGSGASAFDVYQKDSAPSVQARIRSV